MDTGFNLSDSFGEMDKGLTSLSDIEEAVKNKKKDQVRVLVI